MADEQVGKYKILSELGKGAMGVVYKAEDPEIGRIVAVKTLRSVYLGSDAAGQEALQRFKQEARSAGRLKHPNIVTIFETGRTDSGSPFMAMEYVEGQSLETRLSSGDPMEPLEVMHILAQVGSAIDYAHSHGIIHRDIKPSNVIISDDAKPHLLDFGVAKISDTSLTPAGTVVGTPSYMSPEQIRGETLDGATDRFAFAVLAYEMLTGARPFPGHDFMTVVSNIIHSEPIPFSQLRHKVRPEFEPILNKAMSKDKTVRFPSCLDFVRALGAPFGVVVDHNGVAGYRPGDKLNAPAVVNAATTPVEATVMGAPSVSPPPVAPADDSSRQPKESPAPASSDTGVREGSGRGVVIGLMFVMLALFGVAGWLIVQGGEQSSEEIVEYVPGETTTTTDPVPTVTVPTAPTEPTCLIATGCTAPGEEPTPVVKLEETPSIIQKLSNTSLSEAELIQVIAGSGDEPYELITPVLLGLVKHPSYKVRIAVLKVFTASEKFRTREVFKTIVECLDDPEFLVRGFTVKFLASLKNDAAKRLLEAQLTKEKDPTVKKVIEDSLRSLP
jgi:serine/threonine-protein kinase